MGGTLKPTVGKMPERLHWPPGSPLALIGHSLGFGAGPSSCPINGPPVSTITVHGDRTLSSELSHKGSGLCGERGRSEGSSLGPVGNDDEYDGGKAVAKEAE